MEKTACHEKDCKRCGWCCTSLGTEIGISDQEDDKLKRMVFEKAGVIYLRSLNSYFLAMSPKTAEKLKEQAKKLKITVDIKPNKFIYDTKTKKVIIYDYYLNHKKCPFYDEKNKTCIVYNDRPAACKKFPDIDNSYAREVEKFIVDNKIDCSGITYEEALEKCESFCKTS